MSNRNMVEANTSVFTSLDIFCSHKDPIRNSGKKRWISSNSATRSILKEALLVSSSSFSSALKISRFDFGSKSYFYTLGIDLPLELPYPFLTELSLDGSLLTLMLSELLPLPSASPLEVRNIVEVDDAEVNSKYSGHDPAYIASIFPVIRCFEADGIPSDETQRIFFLLCLADLSHANTWMNDDLKDTFFSISELSPKSIPYGILCKSVFDTDPSSVFLALYRCLEALYAYSHVTTLSGRLGISHPWTDVAETLERELGWRPREESSLGLLLRSVAIEKDLREALSALKIRLQENSDIFGVATKQIYHLRNSLVHYRPIHQNSDSDHIDWNSLCRAMSCLVLDTYSSINT